MNRDPSCFAAILCTSTWAFILCILSESFSSFSPLFWRTLDCIVISISSTHYAERREAHFYIALAVERLAGVALGLNLRERISCTPPRGSNKTAHSGCGCQKQKPKTGYQGPQKMYTCPSKKNLKQNKSLWSLNPRTVLRTVCLSASILLSLYPSLDSHNLTRGTKYAIPLHIHLPAIDILCFLKDMACCLSGPTHHNTFSWDSGFAAWWNC